MNVEKGEEEEEEEMMMTMIISQELIVVTIQEIVQLMNPMKGKSLLKEKKKKITSNKIFRSRL